jgi:hypothetical protein
LEISWEEVVVRDEDPILGPEKLRRMELSFGFMFVHELPSKSLGAIISMKFDGHDHFGFAVFAVSSILVCSVQKDFVKQLPPCQCR